MKPIYKVLTAMLIWGTVGICVRVITLPSTELVFMRSVIGGVTMLTIKLISTKGKFNFSKYSLKNISLLGFSGIIMAIHWLMLFEAYRNTTVANATILCYTAPVFTIILSPFILKEKLTAKNVFGVAISMIGLIIISVLQPAQNTGIYNHSLGMTFALGAAVLYVVIIFINKSVSGFLPIDRSIIQISFAALTLLPIVLIRQQLIVELGSSFLILLILGAVHTGIAYILYFGAFEHLPAQTLSMVSYLDPISAIFFSAILLKEPIGLAQILGGGLVIFATALPLISFNKNSS